MAAAVVPNLEQGRFGYLKPKDVARLAEAYRFSEAAHAGEFEYRIINKDFDTAKAELARIVRERRRNS